MDPITDYNEWLSKAAKDLNAARTYCESGCAYEVTTFHCHQAIEKALKGYLLKIGQGLISSHDLPFLAKHAEKHIPELGLLKEELGLANRYYLEMTYPDDLRYEVSAEIAAQCIQIAERLLSIITHALSEQNI